MFTEHMLPDGCRFSTGRLPDRLLLSPERFEELWRLQPAGYAVVKIRGKAHQIRRKQQAYDRAYRFSGQTAAAMPLPTPLLPLLHWARANIDLLLDGVLVNWYDSELGHEIGGHSDEDEKLVPGSSIVTVSFGETRVFKLTKPGIPTQTFTADDGRVFVMPLETNNLWKHAVPHRKAYHGRRISVTLRAFEPVPEGAGRK